jgi:hypothetical protein
MQQSATQAFFQLANTPTNDRLRNPEPFASHAEAAGFHDGSKGFYISKLVHIVANYRTESSR